MATKLVQVDDSRVVVALGKFRLSLAQNDELMQQIGNSQLLSVRRTFRDQGVPAGSWMPLAPSTIRSLGGKAAGHRLLIRSGRLLNSIHATTAPGRVVIGTNLVYAAVQQRGSRDRGFGIGPRTQAQENAMVDVEARDIFLKPYRRTYVLSQVPRGAAEGPAREGGRRSRLRLEGPRNARYANIRVEGPANRTSVDKYSRHQNIPPRPYLIFRPEDPARIRGIIARYVNKAKQQAGLGGAQ